MKIIGKKIITLTTTERAILRSAEEILRDLIVALDTDECPLCEAAEVLFSVRSKDNFVIDFEQ